jgi:antitoxin (DNA-binding transcriptional repressor) of toxin-antitoxin stability system
LIDLARTASVAVAKHGRPFVVVMAIEESERLKSVAAAKALALRGSRIATKIPRQADGAPRKKVQET